MPNECAIYKDSVKAANSSRQILSEWEWNAQGMVYSLTITQAYLCIIVLPYFLK
jgi:hypothetical protein